MLITNLTKKTTPKNSWKKVSEKILGKKFKISIVLAENNFMRDLNKKWRKKDKIASTLSFPLSKNEGEIFLNINGKPAEITKLLVHSLLHLKGCSHGIKMEKKETKYLTEIKQKSF